VIFVKLLIKQTFRQIRHFLDALIIILEHKESVRFYESLVEIFDNESDWMIVEVKLLS